MKFYGLRNIKTKKPLGVDYTSNDGEEFCVSVSFQFEETGSIPIWLVNSHEVAERALAVAVKWNGAGYETPELNRPLKNSEHEVFEVEI
jgi:hypothetical protein